MANDTLSLKIIAGSTREGRFSDQAAAWVKTEIEKIGGFEVEILDLKEYDLPFFDQPAGPSYKQSPFPHENVERFTAKVGEADAFIIVAQEYNHGPSAALKNALDWVYKEWNDKPVAFVGYGTLGAVRAISQLRQIVVELKMASVHDAVHILGHDYYPVRMSGASVDEMFAKYADKLPGIAEQLQRWGGAFKTMRQTEV